MSELDEKQEAILSAWKAGLTVTGFNGGDFGMIHAMQQAITGPYSSAISDDLFNEFPDATGELLIGGVRLVARELAAAQLGYPYLDDAENAMKGKSDE